MELIKIIRTIINASPRETEEIILPIETLNDLPVTVKISITPNLYNYLFFIDVECHEVMTEDEPLQLLGKFFYEVAKENPVISVDEFLESFKKIVNSLRFDRIKGIIDEQDTNFFQELITNPNISFASIENCSVCMEQTKTKTRCNHHLCLVCWSKLKEKLCPLCRDELFHSK
jgi:hypothetical protein